MLVPCCALTDYSVADRSILHLHPAPSPSPSPGPALTASPIPTFDSRLRLLEPLESIIVRVELH